MLSDTEAETSVEPDAPLTQHNPDTISKSRRSIFNITLDDTLLDAGNDKEYADYEARLRHEINDWSALMRTSMSRLQKIKADRQTVDCSILPADKLAFLERRPCLQKFIRESVQFRHEAHVYLEKDVEEARETQENLSAICDHYIDLLKNKALTENLANLQLNRQAN